MIEMYSFIPDGVPNGIGHGSYISMLGVDQHYIEVAVGAQDAPAVPAHGQQGQVPLGVAGRPFCQIGQPGINLGGVIVAEIVASEVRLVQEPAAPLAE
jgi:hypothetical protein